MITKVLINVAHYPLQYVYAITSFIGLYIKLFYFIRLLIISQGCEKVSNKMEADCFVWRLLYTCKAHKALKRVEIFRRGKNSDGSVGALMSPMVVSYNYDGDIPDKVTILPHGNSKSDLPFHPSTRTLLDDIREAVANPIPPACIYNKVI